MCTSKKQGAEGEGNLVLLVVKSVKVYAVRRAQMV